MVTNKALVKMTKKKEVQNWISKVLNISPLRASIMSDFLNSLTEKEIEILVSRGNNETLEQVGKKIGVTRERIRQIEAKIAEKARIALIK